MEHADLSRPRDHKEAMHEDCLRASMGAAPSIAQQDAPSDDPCPLCDFALCPGDPEFLWTDMDFHAIKCPECGEALFFPRSHQPWCYHVLGRAVLKAVELLGERVRLTFRSHLSAPEHAHFHAAAEHER